MSHRTHRPIGREQQVDGLGLRELQESAEFFPGPLLGRKRAPARYKVVENAVESRLSFFGRKVRRRRQAKVGKQRLNEHIVFERIHEKDRMVDQRVVESVTVRLILKEGFSFYPENLQADAGDRTQELIAAHVIGAV